MSLFKYINSLDREYNDTHRAIRRITFNVGRYGETTHTIYFQMLVSEKDAIEQAEAYLSQPLTEDAYKMLVEKDDIFGGYPWDDVKEFYKIRGRCLGDAKFLEKVVHRGSSITLQCGS